MEPQAVQGSRLWLGLGLLVLGRIGAIVAVAQILMGVLWSGNVPQLRASIALVLSFVLLWASAIAFRDRLVFTQAALQVVAIAGLTCGVGMLVTIFFDRPDLLVSRLSLTAVALLAIGAGGAYALKAVQRRKKHVIT